METWRADVQVQGGMGVGGAYLAPATAKMGLRKLSSRKRPEVRVAAATRDQRRLSMGNMQAKDMGM
jgi:hypothetical protein